MAVIDTSALAAAIDSAVAELAKAATELADSAAKDATIAGHNSDLSASQTAVNEPFNEIFSQIYLTVVVYV